jgi:hypothetical protein
LRPKAIPDHAAIGSIGGFPIAFQKLDDRANILIQGNNTAHVSDKPLGTISSLEHIPTHLDDRLLDRTTDLGDMERKQKDLAKHLEQPFEYSERLEAAIKRQAEIVAALDITKIQGSARTDVAEEGVMETIQETSEIIRRTQVAVRCAT